MPRTTAGNSGSDCRMRGLGAGRRIASGAVMVLPRCSIDDPDDISASPTTSVISLASRQWQHDVTRGVPRHASRLESLERQFDDIVGGAIRQNETTVRFRRQVLEDVAAVIQIDADTRQRQAGLVDDHAAHPLRG